MAELVQLYARGRPGPVRRLLWLRAALDVVRVSLSIRTGRGLGRSGGAADPTVSRLTGPGLVESLTRDTGYAVRSLRRDPAFSSFAILVVGLGIGAGVTVFSVAQALLLRPLPFDEPDRLVWISNGEFGRGQALSSISVQVGYVTEMRQGATRMADVGGFHLFDRDGDHTLRTGTEPWRATRLRVTGNFLDVLGVEPALGRGFTDEETWDDGPRSIVLTHGAWNRFFDGAPDVVGRTVDLDGAPATVVGILPASFTFESIFQPGRRIDYLAPYPMSERSHRSGNTLGLVGRLAEGASLTAAQAEISRFSSEGGEGWNGFDPIITPLRDHLAGDFRATMLLLTAGVSLVMLLVCANLSNLLLARATGRARELAVRAAIGAGRRRLVQQLITESLVLAVLGTGLGVLIAVRGTAFIASLDLRIPMLSEATVDGPALVLAVAVALAVGLVFGVVPSLRASAIAVGATLREGGRSTTAGRRRASLRSALVVAQVAIASMLLVGSTLTARSLVRLLDTDLGYDTDRTVAIRVDPSVRFTSNEERLAYYSEILDRVEAQPEVDAAGFSDILPMAFNRRWDALDPQLGGDLRIYPYVRVVSDGYLDAMNLTLLHGRDFDAFDGPDAPRVALVNDVMAEQLWGTDDPTGRTVRSSGSEFRVVGVVRSTRQLSVDQDPGPEIFFTMRQVADQSAVHLLLRGRTGAEALFATARREVSSVDPGIPLDEVATIRDIVDASIAPRRFTVTLLTGFAGFSLVLAALGIYAVIAYTANQRRTEIGIRMALGATARDVQSRLVRHTMVLTGIGLGVGLLLARASGRLLDSFLFGVSSLDLGSYALVALLLTGAAALAAWGPARSAARANPLEAIGQADGTG